MEPDRPAPVPRCLSIVVGAFGLIGVTGTVGAYSLVNSVAWTPALVKWVLLSATANVVYFVGLRHAFAHASVAFVYPVARSSPVLIALWSPFFLGETLGVFAWIGILVSVIGLVVLARVGASGQDNRAVP